MLQLFLNYFHHFSKIRVKTLKKNKTDQSEIFIPSDGPFEHSTSSNDDYTEDELNLLIQEMNDN